MGIFVRNLDLPTSAGVDRRGANRSHSSKRNRRFALYISLILIDSLAIAFGYFLAGFIRKNEFFGANGLHLTAMVLPVYLCLAINTTAYGYQVLENWRRGCSQAFISLTIAVAAVLFIAFYTQATLRFSRLVFGVGFLLDIGMLFAGRFAFSHAVKYATDEQLRDELVIFDRQEPRQMGAARMIVASDFGLSPNLRDPLMLDRLGNVVRGADYVLVCCAAEDRAVWSLMLKGADVQGYVLAPEFDEAGANRLDRYHGHCVMQVASGPLDIRSRILKRMMDLALAIPIIIVLTPLLLAVAAIIKLDSRGPVLFRQKRLGRANRMFSVLKFRTMKMEECDPSGERSTQRADQRLTRVGRILRATSIDELPQLLNVLHGEMSLVGPRPHALGSQAGFEFFWDVDHRYWHRHAMKPGITGLAQVRGFRGATLERADLVHRLQADLEYLNNWSIWRDIVILASTLRVIMHKNAY